MRGFEHKLQRFVPPASRLNPIRCEVKAPALILGEGVWGWGLCHVR